MVQLKSFSAFLVFMMLCSSCSAYETTIVREGCYVDLRGQIDSPYDPPHPENIPTSPRLQQEVTNHEMYYKINMEGYRGEERKLSPTPAGYTQHYSERTPHPYTKKQFLDVWAVGEKVGSVYITDEYATSYFFLDNWATGILIAKKRAKKFHKKPAVFLFVEDLALEDGNMYKAKKMAELLNVQVFYGTIDKQIPAEWVQ